MAGLHGSLGAYVLAACLDDVETALAARRQAKAKARKGGATPPEFVRRVRLSLRVLRSHSAVAVTSVAFLPKSLPKQLSPAVRALGTPRDVEATQEMLATAAAKAGALSRREERIMRASTASLQHRCADSFQDAVAVLGARSVSAQLSSMKVSIRHPALRPLAAKTAQRGAAEVICHAYAQLFLHPAWHLGSLHSKRAPRERWEKVLGVDGRLVAELHDLRKRIRDMRYEMELFEPLFDGIPLFHAKLEQLKAVQGAIGAIHDVDVCLTALPQLAKKGGKLLVALCELHDEAWSSFILGRAELMTGGTQALARALYNEAQRTQ